MKERLKSYWISFLEAAIEYGKRVQWYWDVDTRYSHKRDFIDKSFTRFLAYAFIPGFIFIGLFVLIAVGCLAFMAVVCTIINYIFGPIGVAIFTAFCFISVIAYLGFQITQA